LLSRARLNKKSARRVYVGRQMGVLSRPGENPMSSIYRKGEVLGWGSVGVVYRGWDELLDRPVAIKELMQPFAACEPFSRAFRSRALKMLDVSSRYLLSTYAVDVDRNVQAVVRELADETVSQRSFQGPLDPEEVPKLLRHTLAGLDALHSRGLIHGAVKPSNIFVFGADYKIGDFGLPSAEGFPPHPCSRLRYASPEEIREPERIDRASDIYSLGVTVYELILGPLRLTQVVEELFQEGPKVAAKRGEQDEIWPRFHASTIELPPIHVLEPGVSAALSLTLQKMVAKDLSGRFTQCKKVLASLGSATASEFPTGSQKLPIFVKTPNAAPASAPSSPPASPRPISGWAWAGGGAMAVAALMAGGFLLSSHRKPAIAEPEAVRTDDRPSTPQPGDQIRAESELGDRLLRLASQEVGPKIALEPSPGPGRPRLTLGTPVHFRVESNLTGQLLLFALSPDGSITCIYPNEDRSAVAIGSGSPMILPSDRDRQKGLDLVAQEPLGQELVFAVVSKRGLPPLPPASGDYLREYPAGLPAQGFVDWLEKFLQVSPTEARMGVLDFEIGAAH
jgi:serine/threonine-protein kinase